ESPHWQAVGPAGRAHRPPSSMASTSAPRAAGCRTAVGASQPGRPRSCAPYHRLWHCPEEKGKADYAWLLCTKRITTTSRVGRYSRYGRAWTPASVPAGARRRRAASPASLRGRGGGTELQQSRGPAVRVAARVESPDSRSRTGRRLAVVATVDPTGR